ncbi:tetratricopeptide repeat protein [Luteolibacter sp. AS25]|uniref:tetratricopeptide repeat protein n=1 Tax=Luteolibacter sp. AS25 TaxID=3135776 RepID=UPI00398B13BF
MKKFALVSISLLATALSSFSQEELGLGDLVNNGLKAMNEGNWEEALALNGEATTRFGENPEAAMTIHGPQFGVIWFRKGVTELKLKKFEEAKKSFEACYKDFPNKPNANSKNPFNKIALLKWGEASMGLGQYKEAIDLWKKFLEERAKSDSYPQGPFHVNMAICYFKLGDIQQGVEHLEIAIKNKTQFQTPDAAIISGFQSLVEAAIIAKNEQVITDFISKSRGELIGPPFEMQRFSKVLMKLAADAIKAEMKVTALSLYQLVPSTQVVIDDLRTEISGMGGLNSINAGGARLNKAALEAELKRAEEEFRTGKANETVSLAATAYLLETMGNPYGAYAAYLQLENYYPNAERREDNLYHLFRTAAVIGKSEESLKYGQIIRNVFPDTKYLQDVQKLLLSQLFFDGEYDKAIEMSSEVLESGMVKQGTDDHDFASFVLAGSYFYTGQYDAAAPLLEEHIKEYPESKFTMQAQYFQASNTSRLQYWTRAASQLDAFLKKYEDAPDKTYIPLALFDRANAHYSEDQPDGALEKTDRLISEFPESVLIDQAYVLRGNVFESEGDLEAAEGSYNKALELAKGQGHNATAGEALYYLISLLSQEEPGDETSEEHKKAAGYSDDYWKNFADSSPYRAQIAVAQVNALNGVGRSEDALKYLQEVISILAKQPQAAGLEEAINSYTLAYLESHSPEELKDHYYSFPGINSRDKAARALLRIAIIGVFEGVAADAEAADRKRSARAMIQVLFQNLKTDFELKDLSNYILVKLGDYLRTTTSAPREAIPYYNEVLGRQNQSYRFGALLGRADVFGLSDSAADLDMAIKDFERIFNDSQDSKEREFALYRIIQILMKKGDFEKAAARANQYLDRDPEKSLGFSAHTAEVGLILADSFRERKMVDDAIQMYVKVWGANMGYIKVSAPAMKSWMELSFERNRKSTDPKIVSDRQGAYNGGWRYLDLTRTSKEKFTPEEVTLWQEVEKLVEKYVADPNVKSMKQIQAEKEANK